MRQINDFYPTAEKVSLKLLERIPEIALARSILEPCAGNGAIGKLIDRRTTGEVTCFDINPDFGYPVADVTTRTFWNARHDAPSGRPDWVITNPPFSAAHIIIPEALEVARVGIAMLLPTSWLQPAKGRGEWLARHEQYMSDLIIFGEPRPSFTGDNKTAPCTVAWVAWRKIKQPGCQVHFARNWNKQ